MLKFQTASGQQVAGGTWSLVGNGDIGELAKLPAVLTAQQVMDIIHIIRNGEMAGFEEGVAEGLRRGKAAADLRVATIESQMDPLVAENARLAGLLESYIN